MNTEIRKLKGIEARPFLYERIFTKLEPAFFLLILITLWCFAPRWLRLADETAGSVDQSIWLLVLLSMICFLFITAVSWWLLNRFWSLIGLPQIGFMVSQFNTLALWQQLGFYWASWALLLLAGVLSLNAIC